MLFGGSLIALFPKPVLGGVLIFLQADFPGGLVVRRPAGYRAPTT
jgi:hypothetical protein